MDKRTNLSKSTCLFVIFFPEDNITNRSLSSDYEKKNLEESRVKRKRITGIECT